MSEHAQPGMHPDVEVLSAFAEGALVEHERLTCLDHLAECAQCREIVYLTQAAEAAEAEPAKEPKPDPAPFWKRWLTPVPILSTAAVAALLVASVALYRHQTPPAPQPELMAKVEAPPPAIPAASEEKAAPREPEPVPRKVPPMSRPVAPPPPLPQAAPRSAAPATSATAPLSGVAGTVTDAAGAAVANAQVNLTESAGANSFTSATNSSGQYVVGGVPPGQYEVSVNSPGFQRTQNEIQLQPAQVARADSVLAIGNVSESVAVKTGPASGGGGGGRGGGRGGPGGRAGAVLAAPAALKTGLPSAANGEIMLRADTSGALFRSTNAGKSWDTVKGQWQGKVVRLMTPPDTPGAGDATFQLNTDAGEVWLSRDGNRWSLAPAH
jgi:hypothetical protein